MKIDIQCCHCGNPLYEAGVAGRREPKPGDLSCCPKCIQLVILAIGPTTRPLNEQEAREVRDRPDVRALQKDLTLRKKQREGLAAAQVDREVILEYFAPELFDCVVALTDPHQTIGSGLMAWAVARNTLATVASELQVNPWTDLQERTHAVRKDH